MKKLEVRSGNYQVFQNNSEKVTEASLQSFRCMARHHLQPATTPDLKPEKFNPRAVINTYIVGAQKLQEGLLLQHHTQSSSQYIWGYYRPSNDHVKTDSSPDGDKSFSRSCDSPDWDEYKDSDTDSEYEIL